MFLGQVALNRFSTSLYSVLPGWMVKDMNDVLAGMASQCEGRLSAGGEQSVNMGFQIRYSILQYAI